MVQGISFDGMASGLETDQMIEQLMEIERVSVRRLEAQKEEAEVEQELWQDINQRLQGFDSSIDTLRDRSTFESREVNSANESLMTATAQRGADEANYQMQVKQLATAHRVGGARLTDIAGEDADVTTELDLDGKFEVNGTEIEINTEDSLQDVRDSINVADAGVQASIMDDRLILTSSETGEENTISLADTDGTALKDLGMLDGAGATPAQLTTGLGDLDTLNSIDDELTIEYTDAEGTLQTVEMDFEGQDFDTGEDLAGFINTQTGENIASWDDVQEELTLSSLNEGADATVSITEMSEDVDTVFQNLSVDDSITGGSGFTNELVEAQNALFEVDGLEVERGNNTGIDDVIDNVSLDLNGASKGEVFNLEVNNDNKQTKEAISEFVNEYNSVQTYLHQLSGEDGMLQGDTTARRLSTNLRREITNAIPVHEDYDSIAQLGIEVDDEGNMEFNEATFDEVLDEEPEVVQKMFRAREDDDGIDGIARRVRDRVQEYIRSGDGVLTRRDSSLDSRMDRIDRRIESQERRMERREQSMRRQFTRMETAMNDMQAQQSWLNGQIEGLSGG
ncbi:flagellar filament capping protein FliD [Natroniella sulfidigena]|uniref:flagellar filament capping protein FliD n=1 Tax=Natroniella sulfidigena TaxID=723921 RepID=UPI00200AC3C8|nr:flagellar filament capping protein FliD [Natroniella sulfidigena]MCK8816026.1 flagellar filament capping protein FliD [Natroniella sulfidigena]